MDSVGMFRLEEVNPPKERKSPLVFEAEMIKAPVVVGGYGGWSKQARPRRTATTDWTGNEGVSVQIDFILDNLEGGAGVELERACRDLDRLAGVDSVGTAPVFELSSNPPALMPYGKHRDKNRRWYIDSLSWDQDSIIYNDAGNRVRAMGTMTVSQFVKDTTVSQISAVEARRRAKGSKGAKRKKYTVKKGDTLSKIAARKDVYGDASKWKKIADAQTPKIRDPKKIKVGQVLVIP